MKMWSEATHLYTYTSNRTLYRRLVKCLGYTENPKVLLVQMVDGTKAWACEHELQVFKKYKENNENSNN